MLLVLGGPAAERLAAQEIDPRDLQREVQARQALQNDPKVAPLCLGVRVRNRVATLTGPVPTRELAQHAVSILRQMPELSDVRSHLIVQFEQVTVLPPPALAVPPVQDKQPRQQVVLWFPVRPEMGETQDTLKPGLPPSPSPSPPATPLPIADTVSRAKPPKPGEPADGPAIGNAVQGLILADERFRRVRYEVKRGKVYLSGVVVRWSDLHELSLALTRIPGVESVVLRDVRTEPRK